MGSYYSGMMNNKDGYGELRHYRTKGSRNGISNTPGYVAVGKKAKGHNDIYKRRSSFGAYLNSNQTQNAEKPSPSKPGKHSKNATIVTKPKLDANKVISEVGKEVGNTLINQVVPKAAKRVAQEYIQKTAKQLVQTYGPTAVKSLITSAPKAINKAREAGKTINKAYQDNIPFATRQMVKKYAPKVIRSLDDTYHFTDPIKNGVSTLVKNIKESRKETGSNRVSKLFKSRPVHELITNIATSKMNRDNEKREKKSRLQNEYDTAKKEYDEVQKQYDDAVRRKDFDALETLEKKLNRASDRWIRVRNDYNG